MTPSVKQDNISELWDYLSTCYILLVIVVLMEAL
jgi:hypothetical protein